MNQAGKSIGAKVTVRAHATIADFDGWDNTGGGSPGGADSGGENTGRGKLTGRRGSRRGRKRNSGGEDSSGDSGEEGRQAEGGGSPVLKRSGSLGTLDALIAAGPNLVGTEIDKDGTDLELVTELDRGDQRMLRSSTEWQTLFRLPLPEKEPAVAPAVRALTGIPKGGKAGVGEVETKAELAANEEKRRAQARALLSCTFGPAL